MGGIAFGKSSYNTPRTCQVKWVDLFDFKITSTVKDIKAKCAGSGGCLLPESSGFNATFDYTCSGRDEVNENPVLPSKSKDKSGYMCSCGNDVIPALNVSSTKGNNICRDTCLEGLDYVYSCGVVFFEYARFNDIVLTGEDASITGDECMTMRCGAGDPGSFGRDNKTICTNDKGTEPYLCDGKIYHNYLNTSQGYMCNCETAPLVTGMDVVEGEGAGDKDSCKGKYGLQSQRPSSSSPGGSTRASGGSDSASTSPTATGKSGAGTNAINVSLKTVMGWATLSLFVVGLVV